VFVLVLLCICVGVCRYVCVYVYKWGLRASALVPIATYTMFDVDVCLCML
jgi:hypothetical protein